MGWTGCSRQSSQPLLAPLRVVPSPLLPLFPSSLSSQSRGVLQAPRATSPPWYFGEPRCSMNTFGATVRCAWSDLGGAGPSSANLLRHLRASLVLAVRQAHRFFMVSVPEEQSAF